MATDPRDGELRHPPEHPDKITPEWLTARLRRHGVLARGTVTSVEVRLNENWNVATTARLFLAYDANAPSNAPASLFVKIRDERDPFADIVPGEFAFYDEALPADLPLPVIYDKSSGKDGVLTSILMQDLAETHEQTQWPMPPTLPRCEDAVKALARLHAHWWTTQRSPQALAGIDLRARTARFSGYIADFLPKFIELLGDRLSVERREIMRRVCARLPDLLTARLSGDLPITRVHGDPHFWNVMFHKDASRHECLFFDWEDWHYDPGAFDLAYMIALHWFPERRARYETRLLRAYHDTLDAAIETPYGWEELLRDYRLGHLHNFIVPLFQCEMGIGPAAWWEHLERLFLAYEDLDCAELLQDYGR